MATAEGSVVKDLLEDSGTAALGDALFHFFFGSGDAENKNKIGEFFKSITKNDPRQDFINRKMDIDSAERAVLDEIYDWWKKSKSDGGAGKMENTFVTLVMKVKQERQPEFISLIVREWKWNGQAGKERVEKIFYQLEHDVVEQYLKEFLIEPVLRPINNAIQSDIERRKAKYGFRY